MTWIARLAGTLITRSETPSAHPSLSIPTRPQPAGDPRSLAAVYRAIQVITTSIAQLPLTVERGGQRLDATKAPALIRQPCVTMTRSEWISHMTEAMALTGNAYALIERDPSGQAINLRPLDPHTVWVDLNPRTHAPVYGVEGTTLSSADVLHAHLMPARPGHPRGLGPIEAARTDLVGAAQTRDYAAQWFSSTGQPSGYLSSSNDTTTPKEAEQIRNLWNGLNADGTEKPNEENNPTRVRVLGKGFTYHPLAIAPKDAQWLESQEFNVVQVARLFGVPSSLMMASPSGGSMTYANVEQEWINFLRFTLMSYIRPLEDALTAVTVRGQEVRFNLDALMRSDRKNRFESHAIALANGFLTTDEVRAIEGLAPITTPTTQAKEPNP